MAVVIGPPEEIVAVGMCVEIVDVGGGLRFVGKPYGLSFHRSRRQPSISQGARFKNVRTRRAVFSTNEQKRSIFCHEKIGSCHCS